MSPRRFEVWWCALDPTVGSEIAKTRPAVIVSPDEFNERVSWFTVAPMTTGHFPYASRVATHFDGRDATITVDQLRCVDRRRLSRRAGQLDGETQANLLRALSAFFAL